MLRRLFSLLNFQELLIRKPIIEHLLNEKRNEKGFLHFYFSSQEDSLHWALHPEGFCGLTLDLYLTRPHEELCSPLHSSYLQMPLLPIMTIGCRKIYNRLLNGAKCFHHHLRLHERQSDTYNKASTTFSCPPFTAT